MAAEGSYTSIPQRPDGSFATTHWSVVQAAGDTHTTARAQALEQLCSEYWYPLYAFLRHRGYSHEDAADLTQGLFEKILQGGFFRNADPAKGRFRSFLLGALKHYLADERDRTQASKRGGGRILSSWDGEFAEDRYAIESSRLHTPDIQYDRSWAIMMLERVVERVRSEYAGAGKAALFDALKLSLWGNQEEKSYSALAHRLNTTEAALKMAASRLRRRCREVLRRQVSETVSHPEDIEDELRYIISVLRS